MQGEPLLRESALDKCSWDGKRERKRAEDSFGVYMVSFLEDC